MKIPDPVPRHIFSWSVVIRRRGFRDRFVTMNNGKTESFLFFTNREKARKFCRDMKPVCDVGESYVPVAIQSIIELDPLAYDVD